jgi:hypothetical protein
MMTMRGPWRHELEHAREPPPDQERETIRAVLKTIEQA